MYPPLDIKNPIEFEGKIAQAWKENDTFQKSNNPNGPIFHFFEGPPTANGMPHHGHIMTRAIKDLFLRYKAMDGYNVPRKAGWDTHGLPVEIEVEKTLGLDGKQDIEKYGVGPFVQKCRESVWKYKSEWEKLTDRIGFWIDLKDPYITYDNKYIEQVWESLSQIYSKGLLYKGHKVLPWCPKDQTALSSHEVGQGYKEVEDPAITVAFQLTNAANAYLLAWTTTPWTLPSNVALAINPDMDYAYIKKDDKVYILSSTRAGSYIDDPDSVGVVKGCALVGKTYKPLYNTKPVKNGYKVIAAKFVNNDGTGIVHLAPAYGEDDYKACQDNDIGMLEFVGSDGLTDGLALTGGQMLGGTWFKDANSIIIRDLKNRELLIKREQIKHEYPHCWRCKTPLMYLARSAWFIKTSEVAEKMSELNKDINWNPDHIKDGRFGDFLKTNKDWCISRERYWGTPLPIWECENGHTLVPETISDLRNLGARIGPDIDLHRPVIDGVTIPCLMCECNAEMKRVPEVLDCWYDSGAMPFAQGFDGESPPTADFICEGIDQTRGWFYTLHAISTILNDRPAYKRCVVLGHVLDESGKKYSKHLKNYKSPDEILDTYGADAMRWFFYTKMSPGESIKFSDSGVKEARKFLTKIQNVYEFFRQYANIDGFDDVTTPDPDDKDIPKIDWWIRSRLDSLIGTVRASLDDYNWNKAANSIEEFVDDLSNWHVRRSRARAWSRAAPENQAKWALWHTIQYVLFTLSKILAPFVPFFAEGLAQSLGMLSVHTSPTHPLAGYPKPRGSNPAIEKEMEVVRRSITLGLKVRASAKIKVRRPLSKAIVICSNLDYIQDNKDLLLDELNVKSVETSVEFDKYVTLSVKPDFRKLGPRFGKRMNLVAKAINEVDSNQVFIMIRNNLPFRIMVDNKWEPLNSDDLIVSLKAKDGFAAANQGDMVVVLDTETNESLDVEALVREIQCNFQQLRKSMNLPYDARIKAHIDGDGVEELIAPYISKMQEAILADELSFAGDYPIDVLKSAVTSNHINGIPMSLTVIKES